jgi:hypothetical protein
VILMTNAFFVGLHHLVQFALLYCLRAICFTVSPSCDSFSCVSFVQLVSLYHVQN